MAISLSSAGGGAAPAGSMRSRRLRSLLGAAAISIGLLSLVATPALAVPAVQDQGNTATAG